MKPKLIREETVKKKKKGKNGSKQPVDKIIQAECPTMNWALSLAFLKAGSGNPGTMFPLNPGNTSRTYRKNGMVIYTFGV